MACNNYSKDNKKIQTAHDLECSVTSGIHFCKHNAWAPFYMEFRCPIDFLFKQTFEPLQLCNSKLTKKKNKSNVAGEKPHLTFIIIIIIYEKINFYYFLCFNDHEHLCMFRIGLHCFVAATCFHLSTGTNTIIIHRPKWFMISLCLCKCLTFKCESDYCGNVSNNLWSI